MRKKSVSDSHQKRYGQYFSGEKVADLLAALLPEDAVTKSVIDPMAGVGDLLKPLLPVVDDALAVEIDASVAARCASSIPTARVVTDDAFTCEEVITSNGWDLVITNPPYVRYQLQKDIDGAISSGASMRENLCKQIARLQYLPPEDKNLFLSLTQNYSGLSDMAVPSWILCSALVKMGGLLAIVVPDTWLSREYAAPIQYMLTKCFDVLTIAKDTNACWFKDALVRTCLVVARRRPLLPLSEANGSTFCLGIESCLIGETSLIDGMRYDGQIGIAALKSLLKVQEDVDGKGYQASKKRTVDLFPYMLRRDGVAKWMQADDLKAKESGPFHPADILSVLDHSGYSREFITLRDLQLECGQGLRTGANDFFYLDIQRQLPNAYVLSAKEWQGVLNDMEFPLHNIIKTLRYRSQVNGLVASAEDIKTGVLYIQHEIRLEDAANCAETAKYTVLDDGVSEYITAAEQFHDSHGLSFKDYSAVKPNERMEATAYTRFWYMLPPLAPRHLPTLCMTRVNSTQPECIFVRQDDNAKIIVDANFVTLWGAEPQAIKVAFALLNSTWTRCYLETLCTVMGGGALKLEAAQLKKLQFPQYTNDEMQGLADLGEELLQKGSANDALQERIDLAVLKPFPEPKKMRQELAALLKKKLTGRGARQ